MTMAMMMTTWFQLNRNGKVGTGNADISQLASDKKSVRFKNDVDPEACIVLDPAMPDAAAEATMDN